RAFRQLRMTGFTYFAFVSHKLLRWILPLFMMTALVSNVILCRRPVYAVLLCGQLLFYLWAITGFLFGTRLRHVPYGLLAYFLLSMHLAFVVGFMRLFSRQRPVAWRRTA